MTLKKLFTFVACAGVLGGVVATDTSAATKKTTKKAATTSAIKKGTSVRAKVEVKGIYDQECYDTYYGCMDQFCITDNSNGGSCTCSDDSIALEKKWSSIMAMVEEAERIRTVEVEKVKAGADADIVFGAERQYDSKGNIVDLGEEPDTSDDPLSIFNDDFYGEEEEFVEEEEEYIDFSGEVGDSLYKSANSLCMDQMPEKCSKDLPFLRQVYSRQIVSDCKGFANTLTQKEAEAKLAMANAEGEVRKALQDSLKSANKYDRGQCMLAYKKCMMTDDACGKDWSNCVFTIASENMQNNKTQNVSGTTVTTVDTYDITASTMEILESKRYICEHVLDECINVRDMVWPDFLREAAPTIRVAESKVESKFRQSCLTDISNCIQTACKDDIEGKGVATMDACLARPDMARSFCKVEIDPCERMEPQIWDYVVDKLAAMRVDACTAEVKECFTSEDRCGENFQNCIGMDYDYIHDICPIDSLVVCKQARPDFSMDDLDSMLMGLYLNIDNQALEQCEALVDEKMAELCGSTTDCNRFASDETIGTGSLQSSKDKDVYRVTGMISFGSIKMGDGTDNVKDGTKVLAAGEIGVTQYLEELREKNSKVNNAEAIISTIERELSNIAGTINRTIELISQDQRIQYCVNGRDLSQISGEDGAKTQGRFPNLLNQVKIQIATSALRQAQDNYNKKFSEAVAEATRDAEVDLAQYMCQKMAQNGGQAGGGLDDSTPLAPAYAISYDVGSGLTAAQLAQGGSGVVKTDGVTFSNKGYLGGSSSKMGGITKTTRATFSRETRICRLCSQTMSQDCKTTGSSSWFHNNRNTSCTNKVSDEVCEEIQM